MQKQRCSARQTFSRAIVGRLCQTPTPGVSQNGAARTGATYTGSSEERESGSERVNRPTETVCYCRSKSGRSAFGYEASSFGIDARRFEFGSRLPRQARNVERFENYSTQSSP